MHKAKNCIIFCIDFRFQKTFFEWLSETHNLGQSDIIEVAGSSRDLAKPLKPEDRDELLRNIKISVELHNPENILIVDHQDCGGYAQDGTIPPNLSLEEDQKKHEEYARKAVEVLRADFPDKKVLVYYITLAGNVEKLQV